MWGSKGWNCPLRPYTKLPDPITAYPLIRYLSVDQSPPPPPASPKFQEQEFGGGETHQPPEGGFVLL